MAGEAATCSGRCFGRSARGASNNGFSIISVANRRGCSPGKDEECGDRVRCIVRTRVPGSHNWEEKGFCLRCGLCRR